MVGTISRRSIDLIPCIALALVASPCASQSPREPVSRDSMIARVDRLVVALDRPNTPGAAIAIVRVDGVPLIRTFGRASLESGTPIGPHTLFDAASLAKQFTAIAVAMLARDGRLTLDDPVRRHLPELPPAMEAVTIRHLLDHTSGVRDWVQALALAGWRPDDVITKDDVLRMAKRQDALNFPPGAEFLYSNTGYVLLAEIIERVTDRTFAEWTASEIFLPLGMSSTRFIGDHRIVLRHRARSYVNLRGQAYERRHSALAAPGSSSLFTTIEDMATWANELLLPRRLDPALHRQALTSGRLASGTSTGYGLGLHLAAFRGRRMIAHDGSWAGYRSLLAVFPEAGFGVVVLGNDGSSEATDLGIRLTDIQLGYDSVTAAAPGPPASATSAVDSAPSPRLRAEESAQFAGRYWSPELAAEWVVTHSDGQLRAAHVRRGVVVLTPVEEDRFRGSLAFFRDVQFERGQGGCVIGFRVSASRVRSVAFTRRDAACDPPNDQSVRMTPGHDRDRGT